MRPAPQPAPKALTGLDHRVEAAVGHSIDTLWDQRDAGLLDEPRARLVDAHRALVSAETSVTFYRVLLHRLASGEFPVDEALVDRIGRTVDQLQEAAAARDEQHRSVLAVLEPVEEAARAQAPAGAVDLPARDIAALLAITQAPNFTSTSSHSGSPWSPPPGPVSDTSSSSNWSGPASSSGTPATPSTPDSPSPSPTPAAARLPERGAHRQLSPEPFRGRGRGPQQPAPATEPP